MDPDPHHCPLKQIDSSVVVVPTGRNTFLALASFLMQELLKSSAPWTPGTLDGKINGFITILDRFDGLSGGGGPEVIEEVWDRLGDSGLGTPGVELVVSGIPGNAVSGGFNIMIAQAIEFIDVPESSIGVVLSIKGCVFALALPTEERHAFIFCSKVYK